MKSFFLVLFISVQGFYSFGQKKADRLFEQYDYRAAYEIYYSSFKKDTTNSNLINKLGKCSYLINNYTKALFWYNKNDKLNKIEGKNQYYYARVLQFDNQLNKANDVMQKYIDKGNSRWKKNPIMRKVEFLTLDEYSTIKLGSNSDKSDFGPCFFQEKLIFASGRDVVSLVKRKNKWENQDFLRLYVGDIDEDGLVDKVERFSQLKNDKFNDGPICFSADGNEMFITRNDLIKTKKDKYYGLKIYYTKKTDGDWSKPVLMSFNKKKYSYGHPSLSTDGNKLYFISNDSLGYGQTDIYVSTRDGDSWSEAVNLGAKINSPGKEMTPFIAENKILFFSSDGHPGAGGLDVFRTNIEKNADIRNLGSSVNTNFDDFGFILKNRDAYLCSNRGAGESFDDLYRLNLVKFKVFGAIVDSLNAPISDFLVELHHTDGSLLATTTSDEHGKYSFIVDRDKEYFVVAKKPEYKELTTKLNPNDFLSADPNELISNVEKQHVLIAEDLVLNVSDADEKIVMAVDEKIAEEVKKEYLSSVVDALKIVIYYDFDKSIIRVQDLVKMKNAVRFINTNEQYKLKIESHTDSKGSSEYNLALSLRRAESIKKKFEYLGINSNRIKSIGRGEKYVLNHSNKYSEEENFQSDRRSEIKIVLNGNTVSLDKYKDVIK